MPIVLDDVQSSLLMLDVCHIRAQNRKDGASYFEEPNTCVEDYIVFYLELVDIWEDSYIMELLTPLFPPRGNDD